MLFFSGDGRIVGLMDYYCFGSGELMKSSLSIVTQPDASGRIVESSAERDLWDYPAWRVLCIAEYHRFRKDAAFVRRLYPSVCAICEWYLGKMDDRRLIYQSRPATFYGIGEWTCGRDRLGYKAFLNCLAYRCLAEAGYLADVVGDAAGGRSFRAAAARIKEAVNRHLWSERRGMYVDSLYEHVAQDGNVLAVLFGIADERRAGRVLRTLERRIWSPYGASLFDRAMPRDGNAFGARVISPLMCAYEAAARFEHGQATRALELIRRCWGTMLRKGAGTFWEFTWNDAVSQWPHRAHAWSGGPAYLLPAYVLGLQPAAPGFERAVLSPRLGDLAWAEGVVPVSGGLVPVRVERLAGSGCECRFSVPRRMRSLGMRYVRPDGKPESRAWPGGAEVTVRMR